MKKIKPISNENVIRDNESDENLEKMAKKLAKEWNKPPKVTKTPDLSFSKFEEKLKNRGQ